MTHRQIRSPDERHARQAHWGGLLVPASFARSTLVALCGDLTKRLLANGTNVDVFSSSRAAALLGMVPDFRARNIECIR
jgi:hypothetical protein